MNKISGVSAALQPHAQHFIDALAYGEKLLRVLTRGGWSLTYFAPAIEHGLKMGVAFSASEAPGWVLRARPPRSIANAFDIPLEVLFYCTTYTDLQARTVDTAKLLASSESRSSREVVFLVTQDSGADPKLAQMPKSYGVIPLSLDWIQEADAGQHGGNPLRDRIGKFLYAQDLFDQRIPVVGDRFFGRQSDLHRLRLAVLNSEHLGLLGLRKIGKTSLLRTFAASARDGYEAREALLLAYVDLQSLPPGGNNADYLLWRIGSELIQAWKVRSGLGRDVGRYRFFDTVDAPETGTAGPAFVRDLGKLIRSVSARGFEPFIAIVMDEIEILLPPPGAPSSFADGVDVVRLIRGLTQEGLPVSLIAAGANAYFAEVPRFGEADNPLLNFATKHYLEPLSMDETSTMVSSLGIRMGLRFRDDALALMYQEAGGHPFVTRQLGSAINGDVPRSRPRDISARDVTRVLTDFVDSNLETFAQVFDSLRFYPDEQFLLEQLARDPDSAAQWIEGESQRIRHLKGYGLIETTPEGPRLTVPLFREYLGRNS